MADSNPAVTATVAETGESPLAVRIEVSGHAFTGDEPLAKGGGGLGPSPFDLLTAALAECTAMTVRWYARQQGWPLRHVAVRVSYDKRVMEGQAGKVDALVKQVTIAGDELTAEQRARLLSVAARCPVQKVLEGQPAITTLE